MWDAVNERVIAKALFESIVRAHRPARIVTLEL
jgi:hypothetical protein